MSDCCLAVLECWVWDSCSQGCLHWAGWLASFAWLGYGSVALALKHVRWVVLSLLQNVWFTPLGSLVVCRSFLGVFGYLPLKFICTLEIEGFRREVWMGSVDQLVRLADGVCSHCNSKAVILQSAPTGWSGWKSLSHAHGSICMPIC